MWCNKALIYAPGQNHPRHQSAKRAALLKMTLVRSTMKALHIISALWSVPSSKTHRVLNCRGVRVAATYAPPPPKF